MAKADQIQEIVALLWRMKEGELVKILWHVNQTIATNQGKREQRAAVRKRRQGEPKTLAEWSDEL